MHNIDAQIAIALALGILVGWFIGCLIMDTKHSKELKELYNRNQELEKQLSNK